MMKTRSPPSAAGTTRRQGGVSRVEALARIRAAWMPATPGGSAHPGAHRSRSALDSTSPLALGRFATWARTSCFWKRARRSGDGAWLPGSPWRSPGEYAGRGLTPVLPPARLPSWGIAWRLIHWRLAVAGARCRRRCANWPPAGCPSGRWIRRPSNLSALTLRPLLDAYAAPLNGITHAHRAPHAR